MMKKSLLITALSFAVATTGFAQDANKFKISVGAELGLPTGGFSNTHSFGIGATAQVEFPVQDKLSVTGTGGIIFYNGKSVSGTGKNVGQTIIPIRIGLKYFLTTGIYGSIQTGIGILSNYATGTAFAYSPQLGYEFDSKSGKAFDVCFKYDGYSKGGSIGAFGIRIAKVL